MTPLQVIHRRCRHAFILVCVVVAWAASLPFSQVDGRWYAGLRQGGVLCLIAAAAWLVIELLFAVQDLTFVYVPVDIEDNRRARKIRTQISLLRSLTVGVVAVLAAVSMLMTFGRLRTFGTSLLASAGVVGVIVGVAAQATLRNVLAGLQLAFSDAMRIDDVVVVDGEFGRVEALNLMTVTLHLWDERRLVLPTSYFTTTSFQNWTVATSRGSSARSSCTSTTMRRSQSCGPRCARSSRPRRCGTAATGWFRSPTRHPRRSSYASWRRRPTRPAPGTCGATSVKR